LVYSTHAIKNPSFSEKIKNKALQQNAKGLEIVSSPYWTRSELLREI